MKVELIEKYLTDKYGGLLVTKTKVHLIEFNDLFVYDRIDKTVMWYIDVESDLYSWFGPDNYYEIIHSWFIKQFSKEIGYDK
jgi:hypothetical protein